MYFFFLNVYFKIKIRILWCKIFYNLIFFILYNSYSKHSRHKKKLIETLTPCPSSLFCSENGKITSGFDDLEDFI